MSCPFTPEQLAQLKAFVQLCASQPQILHHPNLSFFREYLQSLGVNLPMTPKNKSAGDTSDSSPTSKPAPEPTAADSEDEMEPESDVELDMEGVIEADSVDNFQDMGDDTKEPTDEERDESDEKRSAAMQAFSEQQYDEAIKLYTEAIKLNPQSALLFAKRGQVYLKQKKPNACIKDCSRALELNCDSAAAYKFRGWAYRLLGQFEEASHDLCESLKIDYDEQTNEWLGEVRPNAERIRQHRVTWQRKKEEQEHRERIRRARKAQEARAEAAAAAAKEPPTGARGPGAGAGGVPPGMEFLFEPETMAAFEDPQVMNAFIEVSRDPSSISKYANNPKVLAAFAKLQGKLGGMGGGMDFFSNLGGGMGGGAGPDAGAGAGTKPPTDDDVGLD